MSSYDEFVHEPISAAEISSGHPFSAAVAPTAEPTRWARSGECGPLIIGFSSIEVDLDELVVGCAIIGAQVIGDGVGGRSDGLPAGRREVLRHVLVVGEDRRRGADLRAHVADRALASGRDRVGARAVVFDDRPRAALDREDPGDLEDDVLRARPARQRAGQADADDLRPAHVEREAGHHVDGVGAADPDRHHAEPAGVRGVRVGADHHAAGERVVLQDDLVDDAAAGSPEADAVLR